MMLTNKIDNNTKFAVIGHGSWATAIVKILIESNTSVNWYVRNADILEHLSVNRNNPKYLSQVDFYTNKLKLCSDINTAIEISDIVILATPSAFLKAVLSDLKIPINQKFIISAIKGIVPDEFLTVAEYLNQIYDIPFGQIGILTGPCHAEEVALERLSYLTMACKDPSHAVMLGERFATPYIRISTSSDIYGAEYASVLKNIYAIAVGMCHSLGYGDNFTAVLISNAASEMERFMSVTYPYNRNLFDSAYLGDLLVTCYSQFSRNRTFGMMIGKGYLVATAQMEMNMVAEGYYSTACIDLIRKRSELTIEMPIAQAMYNILYQGKSAKKEINILLDKLI